MSMDIYIFPLYIQKCPEILSDQCKIASSTPVLELCGLQVSVE